MQHTNLTSTLTPHPPRAYGYCFAGAESLKQVELLKRERLRDSLRVKDAEAALDAGGDRERELRVQLEDSEKQAKWLEQQMSVLKVQVQSLLSENVALKT